MDEVEAIVPNLTPEDLCFTVEVPQLGPPMWTRRWSGSGFMRGRRREHRGDVPGRYQGQALGGGP